MGLSFTGKIRIILLGILLLILFAYLPWFFLVILILNFLLSIASQSLHFVAAVLPKAKIVKVPSVETPFVSIHVPCYNEPPEILKNTLISLSNLDYQKYEVIVIDTNTKDKMVWKPVEKYCELLGEKFRFYHVDKLDGFKAGALNYIQAMVNPMAEYEAVVDADYEVKPEFVHEALGYFSDEKIAFVQFPQAYFNVFKKNLPIALEYQFFFLSYMNMANIINCVSSTGTVTFYKIEPMKEVGVYNEECITEDAELGLRINRFGYKGIFVNKVLARGLIPYDLEAFKKQKSRWCSGNAQILRSNLKDMIINAKEMTILQKIGFLTQLTAWIDFLLLPILTLVAIFFYEKYAVAASNHLVYALIYLTAAMTLITYSFLKLLSFLFVFKRQGKLISSIGAYFVHIGMSWHYAVAWLEGIFSKSMSFQRTNKFILPTMPNLIKNTICEFTLGLLALFISFQYLIESNFVSSLIYFWLFVVLFSVYYVHLKIRPTKLYSKSLIARFAKEGL
jgi:cellulose synthase/poly-beta-1,6-N-acetylglucosamine synthase-like glycosyltransferase